MTRHDTGSNGRFVLSTIAFLFLMVNVVHAQAQGNPSKHADVKSDLSSRPASVAEITGRRSKIDSIDIVKSYSVLPENLKTGIYVDSNETKKMYYRYFAPDNIPADTLIPLILFLHGMGCDGTNNSQQLKNVPSALVFVQPENQKKNPCYFIAPQCAPGELWAEGRFDMPSSMTKLAMAIVDQFVTQYKNVDTNRLYVTGISAGGIGTWDMICKFPGKFAAAVPVSGGWDPGMARHKQNIAVWAFYNADEVRYVRTECDKMLTAIATNGGIARRTVFPNGGHDAWSTAYTEPNLILWLFNQRLHKQL